MTIENKDPEANVLSYKSPFFSKTSHQYVTQNGNDKILNRFNEKESVIMDGLQKDNQIPGGKMEATLVFIILPKDISTPKCLENEEPVTNSSESENEVEKFQVYKTRFWILALFSFMCFTMILVWATFSPIIESAEYAFEWDDGYIALLEGLGSICSVSCMIPFNWMTMKYGLRAGMLTVCTMISLATGLRCISTDQTAFTYLAGLGAMINGAASCLLLSLPALVSVQWFPMKERATATAVCTMATQLGIAGMYFSPLVVQTPVEGVTPQEDIVSDIHTLMFIYFGMASSALVCVIVYFPAKPPTPPSASSTLERIDYFKSIKMLLMNRDVVIVCLIYTFSLSIPFCWMSVMNLSLYCLGLSQDDSMWIAIAASVISCIATFIVARLTDRFHGHMKKSIAALLFGSSCCFFWFLLMTENFITSSKVQVFISIILAMSFQYSTVPLLIEFTVELAYPCPEIAVGAMLSFLLDAVDATFLLLLMINSKCYHWLSYALVGATFFSIIPLLLVNEVYKRAELDTKRTNSPVIESLPPTITGQQQTIYPSLENISTPD